MSALQLAFVLAPTALQLLWLRRLGATRGRARQAARMVALGAASAAMAGAIGTLLESGVFSQLWSRIKLTNPSRLIIANSSRI